MNSNKNYYLLFSLVSLLLVLSACGASTYSFAGKKSPAATIIDSGELYSTYELTASERKNLITQGLKDEDIRKIEKYGTESNWPDGIATLDGRDAVRPEITKYNTYKIATLDGGNKWVLLIPAAKNKHMPENMKPKNDIFFFMGASGMKQ
ncbi:MAG: hypothetical protein K1X92_08265 [Bacteroidia bacterium]|nr:hypothetical protein [Bacteroidia bacterium]